MAVPAFLATSYRYIARDGVSDVQTIMDDFAAETLANVPVWTNPGANLYRSPVDGFGRFFDVLLTRVSQQKLEMRLRDQNGVIICTNRINCPSATVWKAAIFSGQCHFVIDVYTETTSSEWLCGGILDLSPEPQNAHNHFVWGHGKRSVADAEQFNQITAAAMVDNAAPAVALRANAWCGASTAYTGIQTLNGARVYRPRELYCIPTGGGNYKYAGRCCQLMTVPDAGMDWGTIVSIPIGDGVTGDFRVLGIGAEYSRRLACRAG